MIIGGGTSLRWDAAQKFDGPLISCDISAVSTPRFGGKTPTHIVTLEDGDNMNSMFDIDWNEKPPVVISPRTKKPLQAFIREKGFDIISFQDPVLECCWNVGMMAWLFAWKNLGYREVYLNGFDSLLNPDSILEKLWYDGMRDFIDFLGPVDLKTYVVPNSKFQPINRDLDGFREVKTVEQFIQYRAKRDKEFLTRDVGNKPEEYQPILF